MSGAIADALLPPAILPVVAVMLLLSGRRLLAGLLVGLLVVLSLQVLPHVLEEPLLVGPSRTEKRVPRAVVVLAADEPGLLDPARGGTSLETLTRLRVAAALSRRADAPILVSGARAADGAVPVASEMAASLQADFGRPATWAETSGVNVWQSADAAAGLLHADGIETVYLVAEPWEMRLSAAVFRAAGLGVVPAPVPHAGLLPLQPDALMFGAQAWLDSGVLIRQWAGLACQAVPVCVAFMRG